MVDDEEEMLQKAEGTDIEWASGKNPTVKARRARRPPPPARIAPIGRGTARAAACEPRGLTRHDIHSAGDATLALPCPNPNPRGCNSSPSYACSAGPKDGVHG